AFSRIYQECESFQAFSPPVSFADSIHLGMIATGNHEYFDSLRGAPPSSEGAIGPLNDHLSKPAG
ncbi:hypothetical protein MR626_10965, partial [bacterium]|nr:hypothetical protein [bacterium]